MTVMKSLRYTLRDAEQYRHRYSNWWRTRRRTCRRPSGVAFLRSRFTEREIDVRFAISAVAAGSGLFLLALAFYGQPAVYLQEARDQWDQLMDRPVAHAPAVSYGNSEERAAQTRQDAAPLNEELAERQETAEPQAPDAAPPAPPEPASGPRVGSPSPGEVALLPSTPPPPIASASSHLHRKRPD